MFWIKKFCSMQFLDAGMEPGLSEPTPEKDRKSKERVWRNRTTCLESLSKDFNGVLALVENLRVSRCSCYCLIAPKWFLAIIGLEMPT